MPEVWWHSSIRGSMAKHGERMRPLCDANGPEGAPSGGFQEATLT